MNINHIQSQTAGAEGLGMTARLREGVLPMMVYHQKMYTE